MKKLLVIYLIMFITIISCGNDSTDETKSNEPIGVEDQVGSMMVTAVADPMMVAAEFTTPSTSAYRLGERLEEIKAIKSNIEDALKDASCAAIDLNETSFSLDAEFNDTCLLSVYGVPIEGSLSFSVTQDGTEIMIELTFSDFSIDGTVPIDGTIKIKSSGIGLYSIELTMSSGEDTITFDGDVTLTETEIIMNGTGSYTGNEGSVTLVINNVKWKYMDCYPYSGSIEITERNVTATLTYDENTPSTGKATLTVGRYSEEIDLGSYEGCPPA